MSKITITPREYEELLLAKRERDAYRYALRAVKKVIYSIEERDEEPILPMVNDEDYLGDICWSDGCLCDAIHPDDIPCIVCEARGEKGRV